MNDLALQRVLPRLPAAVTWLLVLLLGVQAALIARDLIPQPKSTPDPAALESAPARPLPSKSMDLQGILNAQLFGTAQSEGGAQGDPANAPQTQLSLVLAGTIAMDDPEKGLGLIGPAANASKVYSVGESVDGGVTLHAVYTDRVVLERNGQLEALYLPRQLAAMRPPSSTGMAPSQGAAFANRVQQMASENPDAITSIMRPQPVFAEGKQRGFRVYPGRNRQHFERLGLKSGDLIMTVNGTPLDDPARAMEIFRTIGNSSQVTVGIERGGQRQDLVLDMSQLNNQIEEINQQPPPGGGAPPVEQAAQPPPNPQT